MKWHCPANPNRQKRVFSKKKCPHCSKMIHQKMYSRHVKTHSKKTKKNSILSYKLRQSAPSAVQLVNAQDVQKLFTKIHPEASCLDASGSLGARESGSAGRVVGKHKGSPELVLQREEMCMPVHAQFWAGESVGNWVETKVHAGII